MQRLMEFLTSSYKRELDLNVIGNNFQAEDVRELKKFLKDRREPMLAKQLEFIVRELKEMPLLSHKKFLEVQRKKLQIEERLKSSRGLFKEEGGEDGSLD